VEAIKYGAMAFPFLVDKARHSRAFFASFWVPHPYIIHFTVMLPLARKGIRELLFAWGIMRECTSTGALKYVQIHDLDDSYNNGRVHCSYDLRLQIKQRGSFVSGFRQRG